MLSKVSKKPVLNIIAGPNGSGKTTITTQLLQHEWGENCTYINPDQIAKDVYGDWNSDDAVLKAAKYASSLRYRLLEEKKDIAFETVLSSKEKIDFIKMAKDKGYFVRIFFVCTDSPKINAARIAGRFMEGGHSVPIEKIVSRYTKSLVNGIALTKIVDRMYFYDNSIENETARLLFRISNGTVVKKYPGTIPKWAYNIYRQCEKKNTPNW